MSRFNNDWSAIQGVKLENSDTGATRAVSNEQILRGCLSSLNSISTGE